LGRHNVASAFIVLETAQAFFGTCWCEPENHAGTQNDVGPLVEML
jgi:hypothetical protein